MKYFFFLFIHLPSAFYPSNIFSIYTETHNMWKRRELMRVFIFILKTKILLIFLVEAKGLISVKYYISHHKILNIVFTLILAMYCIYCRNLNFQQQQQHIKPPYQIWKHKEWDKMWEELYQNFILFSFIYSGCSIVCIKIRAGWSFSVLW